jgi:hypothetical protein
MIVIASFQSSGSRPSVWSRPRCGRAITLLHCVFDKNPWFGYADEGVDHKLAKTPRSTSAIVRPHTVDE